MIEKLNLLNDSALSWGKKINELVDTVNNIVGAQDKIITEKKPAECEPVANIDRCETPTPDSFEESKKWIGCLCMVWDTDEQKCEYAILLEKRIHEHYKAIMLKFIGLNHRDMLKFVRKALPAPIKD